MKEARPSSSASGATENRRFPVSDHTSDSKNQASQQRARTLTIDVGGTGLKASVLHARGKTIADRVSIGTPYPCPPKVMGKALVTFVEPLPAFDRVSVGFPGSIRHDKVLTNTDGILGGFMAWEMSPGTPKKSVTGNGGAMP
jgi:predicted NBD/HSP70 family sugar kinase